MPERGQRRYTLEGPCASWALQGRDGRWYRVCVPCDTVVPQGGTLPAHLAYGYSREGDALMSARDHMRQMARNRAQWAAYLARQAALVQACREKDYILFGRLIMGDMTWTVRTEVSIPVRSNSGSWQTTSAARGTELTGNPRTFKVRGLSLSLVSSCIGVGVAIGS